MQVSLFKSMELLPIHMALPNAQTRLALTAPRSSTTTRPTALTSACPASPNHLALLTGVHSDSPQLGSPASGGTVALRDTKN